MKKLFLLLLLILSFGRNVDAQFVNIPDPNFKATLKGLYPTCFNSSDQMNSKCTGVTGATYLNLAGKNISSIDGIQYFTKLAVLSCDNNPLITLPANLPSSLVSLSCSTTPLTTLPTLPTNLNSLYCTSTNITNLPTLPSKLMTLNVSNNRITSFPVFPNTLQAFYCSNNQLTDLPILPNSISTLMCNDNKLNSLPVLPPSLGYLSCYNNNLTQLPALPSGLKSLICYSNKITSLPTLPSGLTLLYCFSNKLTSLPSLPSTLTYLLASSNQITSLPTLSGSLINLDVSNNQITGTFPALPSGLKSLQFSNNQITDLPSLPTGLTYFQCGSNKLTEIPILPSTLTDFYCYSNAIVTLPSLPSSLAILYCYNNKLTSLPTLPSSLKVLYYSNNFVSTVSSFPTGLTTLYCENNQISTLPSIPPTVTNLGVSSNLISTIASLPSNLVYFTCYNNRLTALPTLPATLKSLTAYYNCFNPTPVNTNPLVLKQFLVFPNNQNCGIVIRKQPTSAYICANTTVGFQLSATGYSMNYQWQEDRGSGTFTDLVDNETYSFSSTSGLNINADNSFVGYRYRCKISSSTSATVYSGVATLLFIATPKVSAMPVSYCVGNTVSQLTASGTNLTWYKFSTSIKGSSTPPTPVTTAPGTFLYYVSSTFNSCESDRTAVVVVVNESPSAPIVSPGLAYCQGQVASSLTASGTNLSWYEGANAIPTSLPPVPNTQSIGFKNYFVSQQVNGCQSPRSLITVTVNPSLSAPAVSSPVVTCKGGTLSPLSASGSNLTWYGDANATSGSSLPPVVTSTAVGTSIYYVSQSSNGCESDKSPIVVTINEGPAAPYVSPSFVYCVGNSAAPLVGYGSNLLWYTNTIGGVGASDAPTPTTSIAGIQQYFVSQTLQGCESPKTTVTIDVKPMPTAPVVTSPVYYCLGNTAAPLTVSGNNLQWYTSTTECSGVGSAPVPSTSSLGTTNYYVSGKEGACESERKEIQVIVSNGPSKPTATTTINYTLGAVASALTASGSNLLWYESSVGGTGVDLAPVPTTATVGTVIYYVSQQVGGCESERLAIQVVTSNSDVTGPSCFVAGETVPFELNPKYTQNATGYSWWVNGDVKSVSPSSGSPKTMITVGPYYKSGSVCVVINYSVSPWSKKICTTIDACASSARLAAPEESVSIYPNPSTGYFNISTVGEIQNLIVKNLFGQTVYTMEKISAQDTVYFGVDLPTGIYTVTYQTVSGKVQTTSVVKH